MQTISSAFAGMEASVGKSNAIKTPIIPTTTTNSVIVIPVWSAIRDML
jgi:hypothetical protein